MEPAVSKTNGTTPSSSPTRPPASKPGGSSSTTSMVKYGEIVILGYNGALPQGKISDDELISDYSAEQNYDEKVA